jgi:hypothetical protein
MESAKTKIDHGTARFIRDNLANERCT